MRQSKSQHEWQQDLQGWRSASAYAETSGPGANQNCNAVTDIGIQNNIIFQADPDGTVTIVHTVSAHSSSYSSARSVSH